LASTEVFPHRFTDAERDLARAIAFATEHDLDHYRHYLLAQRARLLCHRGQWAAAIAEAEAILRLPVQSPLNRTHALYAGGRARARLGEPASAMLDEAL